MRKGDGNHPIEHRGSVQRATDARPAGARHSQPPRISPFDARPTTDGAAPPKPLWWGRGKTASANGAGIGFAVRRHIRKQGTGSPTVVISHRFPDQEPHVAPSTKGRARRRIRRGCAAAWLALAALAWARPLPAAPRLVNPVTLRVDEGASVALPRGWGPLRLGSDTPIPSVPPTIQSPFGPSRLVFAQQTSASEGFALVTVRRSDFEQGTPQYLETMRQRDLAILLNHMETRVHGGRPSWAVRLVRSKPPALRSLGGRRVIYWEGEWNTGGDRTAMVRGYAFFGNGAVYLLRVFGTARHDQAAFADEARFADTVATTFRTR